MASLLLPTATDSEGASHEPAPPRALAEPTIVASFGDPVAHDVPNSRSIDLRRREAVASLGETRLTDLVLFLPRRLDASTLPALDTVIAVAKEQHTQFVAIVSTFRIHFGDESAAKIEDYVVDGLAGIRLAIVRPSHVLSAHSAASRNLRGYGFLAPLIPKRMRGCCVSDADLFAAIDQARRGSRQRRTCTLLGPNRPWRAWLREQRGRGPVQASLTALCWLMSFTLIGHLAALFFDLAVRLQPTLRAWNFDTLKPQSFAELLALYNPFNYRHLKVVGYNNGVVHFGQRFPGKTVVSTVHCNGVRMLGPGELRADCGTTIHKAMSVLTAANRELYVLPNYSYVCLGTAFFVPIHGSASDYATVADTITQALLYDPVSDQFLRATREEPVFRDNVYRIDSPVLLLRLKLRVKPRGRYFVERRTIEHASAEELLNALRDTQTANVEIRKATAAGGSVELSKYYVANESRRDLLEVPRDSLGRLWDRLEENAVTSFLMHALTRRLAWHVELFFTADEFKTFWQTHQTLPLKKIQLRYIRRDGLPHSPFCEHDCVSADMFMFRWGRQAFEGYLKRTFAVVRANPGKHSQ